MQYQLIRSKNRWRSASLQVTKEGEILVRAPLLMPRFMIDQFVKKHDQWIQKRRLIHSTPAPKLIKHFPSSASLINYIEAQVTKYSELLALYPKAIKYKSVHTYWGSCAPTGVISFNLHLQYAPREAVEYVVVHELCHLRWRGHGQRFWELVKKTFPQANEMRHVLRQIPRE